MEVNTTPKVSIVVPCYNICRFIGQCLDSLLAQTYKNLEIICVNDGSKDHTGYIISEYAKRDERIHHFLKENEGGGVARNYGFDHATGEYVFFMDGDDFADASMIEKLLSKALEADADIVVQDFYRYNNSTRKAEYRYGLTRGRLPENSDTFSWRDMPLHIFTMVIPTPWTKFYRAEFVRKNGLRFMALSTTNDVTFASLSIALARKIAYVPEAFLYYRINISGSVTSQKAGKLDNVILAMLGLYNQVLALPNSDMLMPGVRRSMLSNLIFALRNYAGEPQSPHYIAYEAKLREMFRTMDIFQNFAPEDLADHTSMAAFCSIRDGQPLPPIQNSSIMEPQQSAASLRAELAAIKNSMSFKIGRTLTFVPRKMRSLVLHPEVAARKYGGIVCGGLRRVTAPLIELVVPRWRCVNLKKRKPPVIVSMTTFPARIDTIHLVVKNIFRQKVKADQVILWLAENQFPGREAGLPKQLMRLKKSGLEIRWCDNLMSHKKYYYACKDYPEAIIVTIDDDLEYPDNMLEQLLHSYENYPNCVSAMRTHRIKFFEDGTCKPYMAWDLESSEFVDQPRMDLLGTSGAGMLIPPHTLGEEAFNEEVILSDCLYADDLWLKVMQVLGGVKVVLAGKQRGLHYLPNTQDVSLFQYNVLDDNNNDKQWNNIVTRYNLMNGADRSILSALRSDNPPLAPPSRVTGDDKEAR